jgi:hypothetical protein
LGSVDDGGVPGTGAAESKASSWGTRASAARKPWIGRIAVASPSPTSANELATTWTGSGSSCDAAANASPAPAPRTAKPMTSERSARMCRRTEQEDT